MKQKKQRLRHAASAPSARCWNSLECISNRCFIYLVSNVSVGIGTLSSRPALPRVIAAIRKMWYVVEKPAPLLVVLPLDRVDEMFSCVTFIIQIVVGAKTNDFHIEQQLFVFAVDLAVKECPCLLRCHIHELLLRGNLPIVWWVSQL